MKPTHDTTPVVEVTDCECQSTSDSKTTNNASSKRRRLLRAGVSAGSVVLALAGKSAMATTGAACRFPSTWASVDPLAGGNAAGLSHHPKIGDEGCGLGRSPGFWKQPQKRCFWPGVQGTWGNGIGPVPDTLPCNVKPTGVTACSKFLGDGTVVNTIFAGGNNLTFSQTLCTQNGSAIWHYIAAYLNALTVKNYPLTPANVVNMWNGVFKVGGVTWTRNQGLIFIQTTYDNNGADPAWKPGIGCQPVVPCKP